MPRFRVYEIVPCKMYYSKIVEAENAEAALKLAQDNYFEIQSEEKEEGDITGDIIGDVTYEVEDIP